MNFSLSRAPRLFAPCPTQRQRVNGGFTLIELMIVVAVLGILAAIAYPSYQSYVTKSRAQAATSDLVGMALALENTFQKTLTYPTTYTSETTIPALPADRTAADGLNDFSAWAPSQSSYFDYKVTTTAATFTVKAAGTGSGMSSSCVLTLTNNNVRSAPSDNSCGFTAW
jgi:type IV pilus assembly protein PilE